LRNDKKVHQKKGIPVLMNLPYLGNAFSSTSDSVDSTEIVILITPHIVKGSDDYSKVQGSIKPAKKYDENVKTKNQQAAPAQ
jgi:general secretion pathway protein D